MVRDVILLGHKQAFCWMDEWFDMKLEDVRKYEEETKEYLDKVLQVLFVSYVNSFVEEQSRLTPGRCTKQY